MIFVNGRSKQQAAGRRYLSNDTRFDKCFGVVLIGAKDLAFHVISVSYSWYIREFELH